MESLTRGWLGELGDHNACGSGRHPSRPRSAGPRVLAVLIMLVAVVASTIVAPPRSEAAGPWHGRVVDAETRKPIEGVVILAVWERKAYGHQAIASGHTGYWASNEVVTNAGGRFLIPPRLVIDPGIGTGIEGPRLALFKAGYGFGAREKWTAYAWLE